MPVLMKRKTISYILPLTAFLNGSNFAKAPESTSSGKEMEVGLVGSSDPGATTSGLLGPADPAAAS